MKLIESFNYLRINSREKQVSIVGVTVLTMAIMFNLTGFLERAQVNFASTQKMANFTLENANLSMRFNLSEREFNQSSQSASFVSANNSSCTNGSLSHGNYTMMKQSNLSEQIQNFTLVNLTDCSQIQNLTSPMGVNMTESYMGMQGARNFNSSSLLQNSTLQVLQTFNKTGFSFNQTFLLEKNQTDFKNATENERWTQGKNESALGRNDSDYEVSIKF